MSYYLASDVKDGCFKYAGIALVRHPHAFRADQTVEGFATFKAEEVESNGFEQDVD